MDPGPSRRLKFGLVHIIPKLVFDDAIRTPEAEFDRTTFNGRKVCFRKTFLFFGRFFRAKKKKRKVVRASWWSRLSRDTLKK